MEGNGEGPWSPKVTEVGLLRVTDARSGRPRRGSECGWVSQSCSVWGCRRVAKVTKSVAVAWGLQGGLRDVLEQYWRPVGLSAAVRGSKSRPGGNPRESIRENVL